MNTVEDRRRFQTAFLEERSLRLTLEVLTSIPDLAFFFKDRHQRFVTASESFAASLGLIDSLDLVCGTSQDHLLPSSTIAWDRREKSALRDGTKMKGQPEEWLTVCGCLHRGVVAREPVRTGNGEICGVLVMIDDLHEAKKPHSGLVSEDEAILRKFAASVGTRWRHRFNPLPFAKKLGLDVQRLEEACLKAAGMPAAEYARTVALRRTVRLLRNSKLPIGEIAERSGFECASSFYLRFRNATGRTPSQVRNGETGANGRQGGGDSRLELN